MVKKLAALLHRDWSGVHEAVILMGGLALLSQVFVLIRDRLLAHNFGAGPILDVYYAAFRIPDLLFAFAGSFMLAVVLVPIVSKHAMESDVRAQKFLNHVFTVFFTLFVLVAVGTFFVIPKIIPLLFRTLGPLEQGEIVSMTRVLLLAPVFFGLSGLLGSVTQMLNKFFAFAIAVVLYNLGIILGTLLFYPAFGIIGLAWGIVLGAFLNFFIYFYISFRNGFGLTFSIRPSFLDLWDLFRTALPRTIVLTVNQIALLALVVLASMSGPGSITVFSFAFSLQAVFLAIVGYPYAIAAFPGLSQHLHIEETKKFNQKISASLRHIIFWLLPTTVLLVVLRAQIVRVLLGSGAFDWSATKLTAAGLGIFAVSIIAQSLVYFFTRGFYVSGESKIPLAINTLFAILIVLLGYGFMRGYEHSVFFQYFINSLFRVDGVVGAQVLMLPLAYSIGVIANAFALIYYFKKKFDNTIFVEIRRYFAHYFFAAIAAGFVAYEFLVVLGLYLDLHTFKGILFQGFGAWFIGIATWWLILELSQNTDVKETRQAMLSKFWKSGIIIVGNEEI